MHDTRRDCLYKMVNDCIKTWNDIDI